MHLTSNSLAIVEQVRDGSSIRVRLLLEDDSHQFINLVSSTSGQRMAETTKNRCSFRPL